MRRDVEWEAWGTPKLPKRLLNVQKTDDGLSVVGECGGSCGGCQPAQERMYVEPAKCIDRQSTGTAFFVAFLFFLIFFFTTVNCYYRIPSKSYNVLGDKLQRSFQSEIRN